MSTLLIIADGISDEPIPSLNGQTPLKVAHSPYLDLFAQKGINGTLQTVPKGIEVNSDTATLSILGYDIEKLNINRAYFEALALNLKIGQNEIVTRCNFITMEDNKIKDFTAGHLTTLEADSLIKDLNSHLKEYGITFYLGASYKNIAIIKGQCQTIQVTSPHNAVGEKWESLLPNSSNPADTEMCHRIASILELSKLFLEKHPINVKRRKLGLNPANAISLWSFSNQSSLQSFTELHPEITRGAIIAGTDLLNGIGKAIGLTPIQVAGATGGYDTNYKGKVDACIAALETYDFVLLHIEASDIASHDGDVDLKIKSIETLDKLVIKSIYESTSTSLKNLRIGILPDHATSSISRKHMRSNVPFIIYNSNENKNDSVLTFSEKDAMSGKYKSLQKDSFIKLLLK